MAPSTTLIHSLLLLASFHATLSWDSSNIWFPDTNNPVFYNMTFYQQAAQTVDTEPPSENLIPATELPRRQRPRPAVFNPLPEPTTRAPVRPTETNWNRFTTPRAPTVIQRVKPNRNRQPPTTTTNGRLQGGGNKAPQSANSRLAAETEKFIRNEQYAQRFSNPGQATNVAPLSGISRLAAEQQMFIRNEQNHQRVRGSPQSSNVRNAAEQHNIFVHHEQKNPDFFPDIAVGYKTVPLEQTTSVGSPTYYNEDRAHQQVSGNRLRRTKNEGIADGGNYFNRNVGDNNGGQFAEQRRWSGNRDAETNGNSLGTERTVEENRRRWNTASTASSDDATNRVEENVIADLETSSKATGPSKCVWAIISCCKPSSSQIRYSCFETLGCYGAFWDTNPCSKEMTLAAVQATATFYNMPRTED